MIDAASAPAPAISHLFMHFSGLLSVNVLIIKLVTAGNGDVNYTESDNERGDRKQRFGSFPEFFAETRKSQKNDSIMYNYH